MGTDKNRLIETNVGQDRIETNAKETKQNEIRKAKFIVPGMILYIPEPT